MMAISRRRVVLLCIVLFITHAIAADQADSDNAANQTIAGVEHGAAAESDSQPETAVATTLPSDAQQPAEDSEPEVVITTVPPQPDKDILDKLLKDYDDAHHPRAWQSSDKNDLSKAVNVTVNMYIRHLKIYDDKYEIQLTLRQEWVDPRLNYGRFGKVSSQINLPPGDDIWTPDTFFQNELSSERHKIDAANLLIRIDPNGHVLYSTRLSLVVACDQDFLSFPMDDQQCTLNLASYGHVQESVRYEWRSTNPIQNNTSVRTHKWTSDLDLVEAVTLDCPTQETSSGTYSCLKVGLNFKRRITMYMWILYLPTILLVVISWLAFWMHTDSQSSRLAIGASCLLLAIALIANSSVSAPYTFFLKASDIWNMTVLGFCFLALIESAIVTSAARKYHQRIRHQLHLNDDHLEHDKLMLREETPYYAQLVEEQPKSSAKRIDFVARIVFPLLFLVFNVLYWVHYLLRYL